MSNDDDVFTIEHRVPDVIWGEGCADVLVGTTFEVTARIREDWSVAGEGRVIAAVPVDGGKALELTVAIPKGILPDSGSVRAAVPVPHRLQHIVIEHRVG